MPTDITFPAAPTDTFYILTASMASHCLKACSQVYMDSILVRTWQMPPLGGWSGSSLQIGGATGIGAAFDRAEANDIYTAASDDPANATLADRAAAKFQVDYVASMERAFRARHVTSIRCAYLAANRRCGQGSEYGIHRMAVNYVQDLTAEGKNQPPTTT